MKILMVAPYPYPGEPIKGGVETVTYNLVEGFKLSKDDELLVISSGAKTDELLRISDNVTVRFVKPVSPRRKIELRKHIKPLMLEMNNSWHPDIIQLEGNGSSLLLYDKSIENKFVVTQHGILRKELKQSLGLRRKMNMLAAIMIENKAKKHVRNWVYISQYNKALTQASLKPAHSIQIYNPVNPKYFTKGNTELTHHINLLFVGVIGKRKGLIDLVKAIEDVQLKARVHVHVVGGFNDAGYKNLIEDTITSANLHDNFTFHGWKTSEEVIEIEKDCHATVLPSYQETLPCVIAEAMAMGKPAIATNICGIPEMIDEGETGFMYEPGDIEGLRNAIQKLSSLSKEEYSLMCSRAREKARKLYDPENVAKAHVEFYQAILNNK